MQLFCIFIPLISPKSESGFSVFLGPGHCGITIKEKADLLTKKGTNVTILGLEPCRLAGKSVRNFLSPNALPGSMCSLRRSKPGKEFISLLQETKNAEHIIFDCVMLSSKKRRLQDAQSLEDVKLTRLGATIF
ncbi:hypothetical protein J6590_087035 [Homalodisca vitripennis]|nr:hypothetical protein J6590_087035 [Homalodisca vitripennis]